jgi:N-acetylglucosamine kinase
MIACFDIGGSAIKCAAAGSADQLGPLRRVPTPSTDFGAFTDAMATLIAGCPGTVRGVAISLAGVIDPAHGRIKCANIPCLDGRALASDLSAALGLPVWIANDADCFALAEAQAGAGRGHRNVFGLILGTGVGGGLVFDGRLLSGPGGFAGEWGHGPVAAHYAGCPPLAIPRFDCGCGQRGCLDTVGGARGLERLHHTLHHINHSSTAIVTAWLDGDVQAGRTIECYIDLLAGPLAMLVNTLGCSVLPVGGGLSNCAPLMSRLDVAVRAAILRPTDGPLIVPGQAGEEPGLIGAAWLGFAQLAQLAQEEQHAR